MCPSVFEQDNAALNLKVCANHKMRISDTAAPSAKKGLLECWNNSKSRASLSPVEYLTLFGETNSCIILEVLDEMCPFDNTADTKIDTNDATMV